MNREFAKIERLAGRLNYRHLHAFWSVAREGRLTAAAERMHVSQSTLSQQIRLLEARLGESLFERRGREMVLTEAGRWVLGYAEEIFSLGGELMATAGGEGATRALRLRVGSVATLSRNFQENLLRPLFARPEMHLAIESGPVEALLARLAVHKLDAVLSNQPVAGGDPQWRCALVSREPVCLVGPPRGRGHRFHLPRDLDGADIVLPGPTSLVRARFDALCQSWGVRPRVKAEVDDMAMLRLLARDSGALAVLPMVVVQDELKAKRLAQIARIPGVDEEFYVITVPRRAEPPGLKALLAAVAAVRAEG